jgi:CheY-like chemotaxis protein
MDLLQIHAPGLVLLDLMMPVKDGFEVLCEMQADPRCRGIPVVVVSAAAPDAADLIARGAIDYARKPLGLQQLNELVARHYKA